MSYVEMIIRRDFEQRRLINALKQPDINSEQKEELLVELRLLIGINK